MLFLPGEVVVVVHQLLFPATQERHDLPGHPLTARVGVAARQLHQVPVVMPHRLIQREQHFALGRTGTPLPALRKREETRGHGMTKTAAAEVNPHPQCAILIGEDVDVVVAASDGAQLRRAFTCSA